MTAALALTVASAAIGCGALIGIEDGVADPGPSAADATTIIDGATASETGAMDASTPDTSTTPDAAPGPIGKPGGDPTMLPCGGASCAIPGQSCCAYRTSSQPPAYSGVCAATCAPPGAGTDRLAVLKCSGPSNCPAATPRCCYHASISLVETSCETACGTNFNDATLCEPGGTNTCGGTRSCQRFSGSTMPPSWGYCN